MSTKVLDSEATTTLVTSLTYLGAGPDALADLQRRLDTVTTADDRIVVGEIETDGEGRPVCGISFNCDSYEPPVDGVADPRAMEDLRAVLDGVNLDRCLFWDPISVLVAGE